MAKLTLSADEQVIKKAKKLAAERGTSVSAMFSAYVQSLDREDRDFRKSLPPLTRKAYGLVKLKPEDRGKTYRQLRDEALAEKYGL